MKLSVRKLCFCAVIAALYGTASIVTAPISYGLLQFRISEALCILPFFFPFTAFGLFAGCFIANLVSAAGILDVIFGSLATLIAAVFTAMAGKARLNIWLRRALACLMPVIFNGLIVGAVLAVTSTSGTELFGTIHGVYALQIALEEAGVMFILAFPLMILLPGSTAFKRLTETMGAEK